MMCYLKQCSHSVPFRKTISWATGKNGNRIVLTEMLWRSLPTSVGGSPATDKYII